MNDEQGILKNRERWAILVFFSESGGRDVKKFSVFCNCSSGEIFDTGVGELFSDFVVT